MRRRRGTAVTDLKGEASREEQREDHDKFRETDEKTQGDLKWQKYEDRKKI